MSTKTKRKAPKTAFKKGCIPWNKGKKMPKEFGEKVSIRSKLRVKEESNCWKGDKVSYTGRHQRVYKWRGQASKCENMSCFYPRKGSDGKLISKPKRYAWATLKEKRGYDIKDYIELCTSCHKKYDLGVIKIEIR